MNTEQPRKLTSEEKRQQILKDQAAAIEAAERAQDLLEEVDREEQEEAYAELQRLKQTRENHLVDAAGLRDMAKNETDEGEKMKLLQLALGEQRRAEEIGRQLGIQPEGDRVEAEVKPRLPILQRPVVAIAQVTGVMALIGFCYSVFNGFHDSIQKMNEKLPIEQHLQPYDKTSIQKFFYEKMVVFSDLPVALLIVFLIVPFVGFYVLPFINGKRNFYTEFTEDLTPWQRSLLTTIIFLGVLFFLALSHTVKP